MSTFLFCFAAWLAMALGMDKHHEDALGRAELRDDGSYGAGR